MEVGLSNRWFICISVWVAASVLFRHVLIRYVDSYRRDYYLKVYSFRS